MPGMEKARVPARREPLARAMRRAGLEAPTLAKGPGASPERVMAWPAGEGLQAKA